MFSTKYTSIGPFKPPTTKLPSYPIFILWSPPTHPFTKLNTDGSAVLNPSIGGIVGIFRSSYGCWLLGYYKDIPYASNIYIKLLAIRDGLELAWQKQFLLLEIESDSQVVLNLLKDNSNEKFKTLVDDCRSLMLKITSVKLQHIFREGNTIADYLATLGRTSTNSIITMVNAPTTTLVQMMKFDNGPGTRQRFAKTGMG